MDETISGEPTSDLRYQRGLALARTRKDSIRKLIGTKFLVPSATANGSNYVVDLRTGAERCSCRDWTDWGGDRPHRCKHIWAAYVIKLADGSELIVPDDPEKPKRGYPDKPEKPENYPRNWRATNACRTLIPRLGPKLCVELIDGAGLRGRVLGANGRPPVPEADIFKTALLRAFWQMTGAEAVVAVENWWNAGLIEMTQVPSYPTLMREFAKPEHMPKLHRLLAGSALPMIPLNTTFAIDGVAFGSSVYDCALTHKHGTEAQQRKPTKRHRWVNGIFAWGVQTHVIVAAQIMEPGGESPLMPELVRRVRANGGNIVEWVGDAAYLASYNVVAVERAGGTPYFAFKEGVDGRTRPAIKRIHDVLQRDPKRYMKRFNQRQAAENGNGILKKRFGHSLQSRARHAQYAECMFRCIAHNVAMLVMAVEELGISPRYWASDIAKSPEFGSSQPPSIELERAKALSPDSEDE